LVITSWIFIGIVILALGSFLLWKARKKKLIFPLWMGAFVSYAVSAILKIIIQRPRPFNMGIVATLPSLAKNSHLFWNFSLPSSHAMFVFATLPLLIKGLPKLKYWWISLAILIGLSRVYFGLHFLSDVLIGGLLGYGIGLFILKKEEKKQIWNKVKIFLDKLTRPKKKN
jgi:undecaprenyl-diphosphatase